MSVPKAKAKQHPVRRAARIRIRTRRSAIEATADGGELAEVLVQKRLFRTLFNRTGGMQKILATYGVAIERAERSGRPVKVVITVDPDRAEPIVAEPDASGDALEQALAAARQRGASRIVEIMKAPDMLSAREFAPLIGVSHDTVNQKRKTGEVLALDGPTRGYRYPIWQTMEDGRLLPGLADLAKELGGPWTIYRFLLQPHPELNGETGLEALKRGRLKETIDAARGIARGNFA